MASVTVSVGGRAYQLGCEDGQEKRLTALANIIDAEVRKLSAQTGPVGEARLLLMTALMFADKLDELSMQTRRGPDRAETAALDAALDRLEAAIAAAEGVR
jgi:cell division protein ZapA